MRIIFITAVVMSPMFGVGLLSANADNTRDVLGSWAFETEPYREGLCVISGMAHLTPGNNAKSHSCKLTVAEHCSEQGKTIVLQACTAKQSGSTLTIRSKIIDQFEEGTADIQYYPDDFQLDIKSSEKMTGRLLSASEMNVTFTRDAGGIS